MLAFKNTEVKKSQLLKSLEAHAEADRIRSGRYWQDNKGCAVGCSIHDFRPGEEAKHELYEPLFGIPEGIAHLEDAIFERLPPVEQKAWPLRFAKAIRVGVDLSDVWDLFALWILVDPQDGVINQVAKDSEAYKAVEMVSELYRRKVSGDSPKLEEWKEAAYANAYAYVSVSRQAEKLIELLSVCRAG